jgi:translation initiation factor eIF-2B subunit delta
MADDEAKEYLYERIDHFIRDRIVFAGKVIETNTIAKIQDGDVVLTFAR